MCSEVLRCSQMFSDDHRCFWIFFRYSKDVLLMFSRCSLDVLRMFAGFLQDIFRVLRWVLWAWWKMMIISNECMDFNDPKEFDYPRYSMIPVIRWTLIIQSLRWYLHLRWSCYNRKHRFRLESNLNCSFRRSQQPHTDLPGDKPWPCLTTNNLITRWWSNLNTPHSPFPSPCQWQIVIRQPTSDLPTSQNCQFFKACEFFFFWKSR